MSLGYQKPLIRGMGFIAVGQMRKQNSERAAMIQCWAKSDEHWACLMFQKRWKNQRVTCVPDGMLAHVLASSSLFLCRILRVHQIIFFFAFRIAQKEARSRVRQPSENQRRPDFSISSYVYIYIKYVLIHKSYHISSSGFYIFYMFISVIPFGAFAFVFSMASDFFPCSSDEI